MGIAVGVPDRVLDRVWNRSRRRDGVVDAMAEPPDELRVKICKVCHHRMELGYFPVTQPVQPEHRWQCLCGHWEPTIPAKEWGEV